MPIGHLMLLFLHCLVVQLYRDGALLMSLYRRIVSIVRKNGVGLVFELLLRDALCRFKLTIKSEFVLIVIHIGICTTPVHLAVKNNLRLFKVV